MFLPFLSSFKIALSSKLPIYYFSQVIMPSLVLLTSLIRKEIMAKPRLKNKANKSGKEEDLKAYKKTTKSSSQTK